MIGSVGIIRDITPLRKLQQEMRERENLALIGEVVSSIAHSLSNPLNIISGNADFLLFDKKENDKDYEEIKIILDETTRITKSIRHLLNFSRQLHTEKKINNFNDILLKVVSEFKFQAGNKKIKIKKNLKKDLPSFNFDESQIEEVVSNIITNAIQAIPKEGEISVKSIFEDNKIVLEISDNGNGIPKENLSKIFLPFYSTKEYGKGTGLGLAISKRVVIEHGGQIAVESKVGKGTKFKITFPV
jgi:signal transduction histidine kinase